MCQARKQEPRNRKVGSIQIKRGKEKRDDTQKKKKKAVVAAIKRHFIAFVLKRGKKEVEQRKGKGKKKRELVFSLLTFFPLSFLLTVPF